MKYSKHIIVIIIFLICAPLTAVAQSTWKTLTGIPESTDIVGACAINGKIYCISTDWWTFSKPRSIYEYDPSTDTWTKKSAMPDKRTMFVPACINDKIYAIGGLKSQSQYTNTVSEYDPVTDKWTTKRNMPTTRADGIPSVVFNNKIYIVGGGAGISAPVSGAIEVYDPANDEWMSYKSLPTPRAFTTVLITQNKLYVINGFPLGWDDATGPATITEVLNLQTKEYEIDSIPAFPRQVMETQHSSLIGNKYYLFCDFGSAGINKLVEFDPATGKIEYKRNMITTRMAGFTKISYNNKIYVVGGGVDSKGTPTDKAECYDPSTNTWTVIKSLSKPGTPTLVALNGKIYAIGNRTLEVYDTKDDPSATNIIEKNKPYNFNLFQNYPNPFNPETVISYQIPIVSQVVLKIFDILGKEITTLVDKEQAAGVYKVKFDGSNLNSGIYFCQMKSGNFNKTQKMLLIK